MNWKPADIAIVKAVAGEGGGGSGGVTPNIQATAETLPAGSEATVTRTGSDANPVFNFGIPKGDPGNPGTPGDPGAKGDPGKDATINGKNAVTLAAGENVSIITGEDGTVTISASGGGGTAGVASFNGRQGAVTPQTGDYTAEMVGAVTAAEMNAAISAAITGAMEEAY